jgi:hypothetical protein
MALLSPNSTLFVAVMATQRGEVAELSGTAPAGEAQPESSGGPAAGEGARSVQAARRRKTRAARAASANPRSAPQLAHAGILEKAAQNLLCKSVELTTVFGADTLARGLAELRASGAMVKPAQDRAFRALDAAAAFLRHPRRAQAVVRDAAALVATLRQQTGEGQAGRGPGGDDQLQREVAQGQGGDEQQQGDDPEPAGADPGDVRPREVQGQAGEEQTPSADGAAAAAQGLGVGRPEATGAEQQVRPDERRDKRGKGRAAAKKVEPSVADEPSPTVSAKEEAMGSSGSPALAVPLEDQAARRDGGAPEPDAAATTLLCAAMTHTDPAKRQLARRRFMQRYGFTDHQMVEMQAKFDAPD